MSEIIGKMLQEHSKLFEKPVSKIGELHYRILKSQEIVEAQKKNDRGFETEIGQDEIHWWVFYKEKDLKELKSKTEKTLEDFQRVKENAVKIRQSLHPNQYSELIDGIRKFCVDNELDIQSLLDYVNWLNAKDPRSVVMMFNYRVWGSTRMGDREIPVSKKDEKDTVNACIEIALGLRRAYHGPMISRALMDVSSDMYDSMQPENYSTSIIIPWDAVVSRASNEILTEMTEYFTCLRNSLRNILLEIEEYEKSIHILYDGNFWKLFVKKTMTLPIENMMWDFKETLSIWKKDNVSKKKKRQELCEDIASFANKQGGVLIIGISNEMPRKIVGLDDLENKVKHIKDIIQEGIDYERDLTHFQVLSFEEENKICLLIIIKSAMQKVGVKMKKQIKSRDFGGSIITSYCPVRHETGIVNLSHEEFRNEKPGMKHDSFEFVSTLYTNYSGKK